MAQKPAPGLVTQSGHSRLTDENVQVRIPTSVICDTCGYNLKGSPFVGTCPECGTPYNARRAIGKNIYRPDTAQIAWTPPVAASAGWLLVIAVLAFAVSTGRFALVFLISPLPLAALAAGLLAASKTPEAYRELRTYLRHRRWEKLHAESFAEERERRRARQARAAEQPAPTPREPLTMPNEETRERLRAEGHLASLDWPALCATCGYRLQHLPKLGICPECGSKYDARPNKMRNVMSPYGGILPWGDIWATAICGAIALMFVLSAINSVSVASLVLAVLFVAGTVAFAVVAARKARQYTYAHKAMKQLQMEEEDESAPDIR